MTTIERYYEKVSQAGAPLRVTMLGIRGFPNVQGGAENHAQNLSVNLSKLGCDVEVIVRSPARSQGEQPDFRQHQARSRLVTAHEGCGDLRAHFSRRIAGGMDAAGHPAHPLGRARIVHPAGARLRIAGRGDAPPLELREREMGPGGAGDTAIGRARRNDLRQRPHRGIGGIGEPHGARLSGARAHHPERDPQPAEDAIDRDPGRIRPRAGSLRADGCPDRRAEAPARSHRGLCARETRALEARDRGRRRLFQRICPRGRASRARNRRCRPARTSDRRGAGRIIHACRRVRAALQP